MPKEWRFRRDSCSVLRTWLVTTVNLASENVWKKTQNVGITMWDREKRWSGLCSAEGKWRRENCGSANSAGAAEEIIMTLMRAEAADYHTMTRDSPTAWSVTALSYFGISFSTIVWSAHYVSLSLLSSIQPHLFIPPCASKHWVSLRLCFSPFLLKGAQIQFCNFPLG